MDAVVVRAGNSALGDITTNELGLHRHGTPVPPAAEWPILNHSCVLMLLSDWWILTIHRKFREHSICVSKRRSQKCQEGRANEGPLGRSIGFNMMYSDSFRSTSDTKRELTYHTRKGSQLDSRTQRARNSPKSSIPSIPNLHISTAVKRAPTA